MFFVVESKELSVRCKKRLKKRMKAQEEKKQTMISKVIQERGKGGKEGLNKEKKTKGKKLTKKQEFDDDDDWDEMSDSDTQEITG